MGGDGSGLAPQPHSPGWESSIIIVLSPANTISTISSFPYMVNKIQMCVCVSTTPPCISTFRLSGGAKIPPPSNFLPYTIRLSVCLSISPTICAPYGESSSRRPTVA
ncbi:hypothetical protein Vafri_20718 [Volvox africanus]|uniref:Uncharacterized protein n=1 Tax=Volvox africanus TaxID=51714 RepID=A0A8J4BRW1_9CHLO|nr:hypothetical protein Vafri_20718 [Volvox africanus]